MYTPRKTQPLTEWIDPDGLKIYMISASGDEVNYPEFIERLNEIKEQKSNTWRSTPAFAIFHEGASIPYLVVAWWGNDNELFTSVSVREDGHWVEDPDRYSFCLWDLEVIQFERESYIRYIYTENPDIQQYRNDLMETIIQIKKL